MVAGCLPTVRSTDQSFARLQALILDAVGPLTDLMERMAGTSEEEDHAGIDLQVVEDAVHSALAFLGNAATQFSTYRRTKILEEYNKDLVSFSEEMEPELRAAAPLLFGSSFTKQAADHLGQMEALHKVKGKNKKVCFYSTLFLVPTTEGRMRPVINLKALNFWVQTHHFKMEDIHMLRETVAEGEWLAKLDLKDGYFTVPIFQDHQK